MSVFTWLRNAQRQFGSAHRSAHASSRPRTAFRPHVEVLEGRDVPSTLTVTNNLDSGPGSLRAEIAAARNKDTIVFAPSLDGQTITLSGGELDITKNLTIQGPGAGLLTVNGGRGLTSLNGSRVFAVEKNVNVILSGLTITGGGGTASAAPYWSPNDNKGGGILNLGALTISGCTVTGNYADPPSASSYGGGIYNAGTLIVSNSTVSDNFAEYVQDVGLGYPGPTNDGGGIYNAGMLTVTNSDISGNLAWDEGGGIYNAGTATISGCTVSGNTAYGWGGGIYNAGTLTVSSSTFSGNMGAYTFNSIYGPYTDGGGNTFS